MTVTVLLSAALVAGTCVAVVSEHGTVTVFPLITVTMLLSAAVAAVSEHGTVTVLPLMTVTILLSAVGAEEAAVVAASVHFEQGIVMVRPLTTVATPSKDFSAEGVTTVCKALRDTLTCPDVAPVLDGELALPDVTVRFDEAVDELAEVAVEVEGQLMVLLTEDAARAEGMPLEIFSILVEVEL